MSMKMFTHNETSVVVSDTQTVAVSKQNKKEGYTQITNTHPKMVFISCFMQRLIVVLMNTSTMGK